MTKLGRTVIAVVPGTDVTRTRTSKNQRFDKRYQAALAVKLDDKWQIVSFHQSTDLAAKTISQTLRWTNPPTDTRVVHAFEFEITSSFSGNKTWAGLLDGQVVTSGWISKKHAIQALTDVAIRTA